MRCIVRALSAPLALALVLSAGLLLPTAASASFGQSDRSSGTRSSSTWDDDGGSPRVRFASAYYGDTNAGDDDEARPRRRYRTEDGARRPRYTQRRQHRHARLPRRGRHIAQQRGRRMAHHRAAPRRATSPAWSKRSLSTAPGPRGSDTRGVASFYWEPQRVASGGWFNPSAMTAAHRTLPFGTRVRVTHLSSGRTVEVKINDRGPYIAGRIIDLSKAAAGVIGMTQQGIARVAVEVLGR